jgi:hypothetical protein
MPLDLYKVGEKGSALSITEHDANLTDIEEVVDELEAAIAAISISGVGPHSAALITSGTLDNARLSTLLAAFGGLTAAANKLAYFNSSTTMTTATLTAYALTLLDDANAAASRTTLDVPYRGASGARISTFWTGSQAAYNALGAYDSETLYVIV